MPENPKAQAAPLIHKGTSLAVLCFAITRMLKYASQSVINDNEDQRRWVTDIIFIALQANDVMFVPWYYPPSTKGGRRSNKAQFDSWVLVDAPDANPVPKVLRPVTENHEEEQEELAASITAQVLQSSSRSAWSMSSVLLSQLSTVLKRQVPPSEFTLDICHLPKDPEHIVAQTYRYVFNNFNFGRPIHHLSIIVAGVFSHLLPYVFFETQDAKLTMPKSSSHAFLTDFVRNTPWLLNNSRKGHTQPDVFIPMMTFYILALWDENSPVRQLVRKKGSLVLGKEWTDKHNAKGLTGFNLVRLGLAEALTTKIVKPVFQRDWQFFSDDKLIVLYHQLIQLFNTPPYGPYDAVKLLAGQRMADHLAEEGQLIKRASVVVGGSISWPIVIDQAGPSSSSNSRSTAKGKKRAVALLWIWSLFTARPCG